MESEVFFAKSHWHAGLGITAPVAVSASSEVTGRVAVGPLMTSHRLPPAAANGERCREQMHSEFRVEVCLFPAHNIIIST